jgi:hypothetical protein
MVTAQTSLRTKMFTALETSDVEPSKQIIGFKSTCVSVAGQSIASWNNDPLMSQEREREIISFLGKPFEPLSGTRMKLEQVAALMRDEVPISIDYLSFIDQDLSAEELEIETLENQNLPLLTVLQLSLSKYDVGLEIESGVLIIQADSNRRDCSRSYDVTPLLRNAEVASNRVTTTGLPVSTAQRLLYSISTTIDANWQIDGGSDHLVLNRVGSRQVMTTTTSLIAHLQIQAFLEGLNRMNVSVENEKKVWDEVGRE